MNTRSEIKIILLFLLFIFSNCFAQEQNRLDSLMKKAEVASLQEKPSLFNRIADEYLKQSADKAEGYANKALIIARNNNDYIEQAHAYKIKSSCYLQHYRYSEAIETSKSALEIYLRFEKLKDVAGIYNQMGLIYKQHLEYEKSFENLNQAINYFKMVRDSMGIAETNGYLGSLFLKQSEFEKAYSYYTIALRMYLRTKDSVNFARSYYNIALVDRESGRYNEALSNLAVSLALYEKLNIKTEQGNVLNFIGGIYLKKNEYKNAVDYYQKSASVRELLGERINVASSYNNLGLAYMGLNDHQKALDYFFKSLAIRRELDDQKAIAISLNHIGSCYLKTKNYYEALSNYLESLKICLDLDEKTDVVNANINIGNIYYDLNNFTKALEYFSEALATSSNIDDNNRIANAYLLLGNTFSKLGKVDEALSNYKNSLGLRQKMGDQNQAAVVLNNIGSVYSDKGNLKEAIRYYVESLELRRKINDKTGISITLNNIGNLYLSSNNNTLALNYFEQAMKIAEEIRFQYNIALCSRKIGEIYMASKNYDKALNYFERSVKLGIEINNFEILKKGYQDMYHYALTIGDNKKALENFKLFTIFNDTITASMTNQKLLDIQLNFEMSRREGEIKKVETQIALLKKERQINEFKDQRRKQTIIILLIVILSVLSFGVLYYNRYQLKHRTASALQEKINIIEQTNLSLIKAEEELKRINNTKDKFFSILAHDIKNPLGGLISITDLMKADFNEISDQEKLEIFETINKSSHQLYNLLENLLHWSRSQTGKIPFNPVSLKPFELAEASIDLLKANAEKKNIMIINMVDQNISLKADKDMIMLVIRNLVSNAIKFTRENGKIIIASEVKDNHVFISVEDNGIGISKEDIDKLFRIDVQFTNPGTQNETGTGLGLILCQEFVIKNKGKIWAECEIGKGSKFIFKLPVS
jgi:signal transduction histidine kinase/uncharacterized protein HemY